MKPHQIPFSTAIWPPSFFHAGSPAPDKNGVLLGLRANPFIPGPLCEGDCKGPNCCNLKIDSAEKCNFLKHYRQQLDKLNFNKVIKRLEELGLVAKEELGFEEEPELILIVFEAPQNPCSERRVIQEWFSDHGMEIEEWQSDNNQ